MAGEDLRGETIRCIGQIAVSVLAMGGGIAIVVLLPDQRAWGVGMICTVVGYWLR